MTLKKISNSLNLSIAISLEKVSLSDPPVGQDGCWLHICPNLEKRKKEEIMLWLEAYLEKKLHPPVPNWMLNRKTLFQKKVLQALLNIPIGHTSTYLDIAKKIESPLSARAVGNACNKNPMPLFIPCHRVIRTIELAKTDMRKLGGFAVGTSIKKRLLEFETAL